MSKLEKFLISTNLDEVGMRYTLTRFKNEEIYDFKRRVDFVIKQPPKNTFDSFSTYSNLSLGFLEKNILKIERVDKSIGFRIKVDSCFIYIYKITKNNIELDIKINYNEDIRYVKDFLFILDSIDYIKYEKPLEENIDYLEIFNLKIQDSLSHVQNHVLNGKMNNLKVKNIKQLLATKKGVFVYEKEKFEEVVAEGDYYIDYEEGIVFTYVSGVNVIDLIYYEDPFYLKWQPVKTYLFNDPSIDSLTKDNHLIENELIRSELNEKGNDIVNSILEIDPLYWGE